MRLEPGDTFPISYGNGHTVDVVTLSIPQKRKLIQLVSGFREVDKSHKGLLQVLDLMQEIVSMCVPSFTEEWFGTIDESMAAEIWEKTLAGQSLSDDERKKSGSPPSSAAANCADHADTFAAT